MKKFSLCFLLLLLFAPVCFADFGDNAYVKGINIQTYISNNTTAVYKVTNVSTSTFLTSYRILGFEVIPQPPTGLSAGLFGILYDTTSGTGSDSEMIGEVIPASSGFDGIWFPYPKIISSGLTIVQGEYTKIIIYYIAE